MSPPLYPHPHHACHLLLCSMFTLLVIQFWKSDWGYLGEWAGHLIHGRPCQGNYLSIVFNMAGCCGKSPAKVRGNSSLRSTGSGYQQNIRVFSKFGPLCWEKIKDTVIVRSINTQTILTNSFSWQTVPLLLKLLQGATIIGFSLRQIVASFLSFSITHTL